MNTLLKLATKVVQAEQYYRALGMQNCCGLTAEQQEAQSLQYQLSKAALWKAQDDYEKAVINSKLSPDEITKIIGSIGRVNRSAEDEDV